MSSKDMVEIDSDEEVKKACERFGIDYESLPEGKKKEVRLKAKKVMEKVL